VPGDEVSKVVVAEEGKRIGSGDSHVYGSIEVDDTEVHRGIINGCELGFDELCISEQFCFSVGIGKQYGCSCSLISNSPLDVGFNCSGGLASACMHGDIDITNGLCAWCLNRKGIVP
jgi:hypothetical protein